ncbi:hypothetical protein CRUP_038451, partial [Coryphaenoides rupestris]
TRGAGRGGMELLRKILRNTVSVKVREYVKDYCRQNGLLTLSVFAVVTGCVLGFLLRSLNLSTQAKIYFSFPGELLMRMLKMLILPLITSSLMSGLSAMDTKASGRLGVLTITYYLWTTFIAVIVGIILVLIIHPGTGTEKETGHHVGSGPVMTSADALLDLIRYTEPYRTDLVPIVVTTGVKESQANYVYVMPDYHNPQLGHPVFLDITPAPDVKYKIMGERGAPLVNVCQCVNECVMKIINAAMWYFPFGIVFLVAGKILDMHDPAHLGEKLGMYFVTVLAGLFVHGLVLLPLFFYILTHKNPFAYIRGLLQALAVAAIFIAQVNDYELDFGQLVTISDRFRTMINVLGDALAAGIMAHLCKKDFEKAAVAAAAAATANTTGVPTRRDTVISFGNQSVTLSEAPLMAHRCDYVFDVDGEQVTEKPMPCYNLCQV